MDASNIDLASSALSWDGWASQVGALQMRLDKLTTTLQEALADTQTISRHNEEANYS